MDFDTFTTILDDAEREPRAYFGRAIYGKHCVSIIVREHENPYAVVASIVACNHDEVTVDKLLDVLTGTRTDSLRYDTVMYWPSIKWAGPTDDEGDEQ
ncbi:hypothetical protein [Cupriavidus taiwanensis]|uniref:hypothetical protein n=1 Tax=Cupriavidus taiwanensis TaxID=164546 RepID=UPI000E187C6D|nr:hypothetical protein [Cupriavidus taiwanensis]SPA17244.1 hypothetical protein CBM2631_A90320 [Cupriavidus taiwanensis]